MLFTRSPNCKVEFVRGRPTPGLNRPSRRVTQTKYSAKKRERCAAAAVAAASSKEERVFGLNDRGLTRKKRRWPCLVRVFVGRCRCGSAKLMMAPSPLVAVVVEISFRPSLLAPSNLLHRSLFLSLSCACLLLPDQKKSQYTREQ